MRRRRETKQNKEKGSNSKQNKKPTRSVSTSSEVCTVCTLSQAATRHTHRHTHRRERETDTRAYTPCRCSRGKRTNSNTRLLPCTATPATAPLAFPTTRRTAVLTAGLPSVSSARTGSLRQGENSQRAPTAGRVGRLLQQQQRCGRGTLGDGSPLRGVGGGARIIPWRS